MDWQMLITSAIVVLAAGYLVRSILVASKRSESGCGGGCRCDDVMRPRAESLGRKRELIQLGTSKKHAGNQAKTDVPP